MTPTESSWNVTSKSLTPDVVDGVNAALGACSSTVMQLEQIMVSEPPGPVTSRVTSNDPAAV